MIIINPNEQLEFAEPLKLFSNLKVLVQSKSNKGFLAQEYHPFFNLRKENGEITELVTEKLNFSLQNPVEMIPQQSYDGSINLIINDKKNPPRLINSRFTVREKNTYERVDRLGENDTNLYDVDKFNLQTSLQKLYTNIPQIKFNGESSSGNLKVGNYVFYFTYCDADENETDIVAESGIVSIFKGTTPHSIDGGFRDENSYKTISFTLNNIDSEYSYIKVYYIRYSSDIDEHRSTNAYKLHPKYCVKDNRCDILITGFENYDEISVDELNIQYASISSAGTQAISQNTLFLGNIEQIDPLYEDLKDISLRILPYYTKHDRTKLIGDVNNRYVDYSINENNYEYYNIQNIYNYVGYSPNEIYRIGIVYIMQDNSLSFVYNIRGMDGIPEEGSTTNNYTNIQLYDKENQKRLYIKDIDEATSEFIGTSNHENSKGVIRIKDSDTLDIYSLSFHIENEVLDYLKSKNIKGYFFVRQKRIPTILGQALVLPIDENTYLPTIPTTKGNIVEGIMDKDRILTHTYQDRLLISKNNNQVQGCLIFPEFEINQPYFNSLFTGAEFTVKEIPNNNISTNLTRDQLNERHYYIETRNNLKFSSTYNKAKLISVADNVKLSGTSDYKFRARAGETEEGFRYEKIDNQVEDEKAYNYVRGSFGPYVGMITNSKINYAKILEVYIPGYSDAVNYFSIRYQDSSSYYTISDRKNLTTVEEFQKPTFRGDSYICNFTHRLNRNFQDPTSPVNDKIIDKDCWQKNFKVKDGVVKKESFNKINLGDLNAVQLGSWITFKVRCSKNLSIRSQNKSYVEESILFGHPRSFYPLTPIDASGTYKIPESDVFNDSFASTLGTKQYILIPDVPYLKDKFQTRIFYSDMYINDAYINGYRRFINTQYRDYGLQYGGLVKLINYGRNLVGVFEHGILLFSINQQTAISSNAQEPIFINSKNVLPETPIVVSDNIGSQYKDSIIKTDTGIYGIDTYQKKIWKFTENGIIIISNHCLESFLKNNILESESNTYLGIKNVKTHYNRNKRDVIFTYYDNLNSFEEIAWSLCYNEDTKTFTTFYSWIPSFSVNLYNNFYTFDRQTSKYISKLGISYTNSNDKNGIVLNDIYLEDNKEYTLDLVNVHIPELSNDVTITKTFTKEKDIFGFHNYFTLENNILKFTDSKDKPLKDLLKELEMPVVLLNIKCQIILSSEIENYKDIINNYKDYVTYHSDIFKSTIALMYKDTNLQTEFWSHNSNKPTNWYGKQHPFEFEFIVRKDDMHKIFDNLIIISNNAEPESFHYEIIGDSYEFAKDKKNMYIRQEATKCLYQYNNTDITYDKDFFNINPDQQNTKSTLLPLYYSRQDKINTIEDYYHLKDGYSTKDFSQMAGAEIVHNKRTDEYSIWNHSKCITLEKGGRLRGNTQYLDNKWLVQIAPLNIKQANEPNYEYPPIEITQSPIPDNILQQGNIELPEELKNYWNNDNYYYWKDYTQEEAKIQDREMKVRIRYKGDKLAIIRSVYTLFSYLT